MKTSLLLAGSLWCASALAAADRPNLLLITADDLNANSPGWMGNPLRLTPNLDALAATGHRFVNNHVSVPICQPSRAALMTGRVPHRSGTLGFDPVNEGTPTLVTLLQKEGYFTAAMNKLGHMQPKSCFPWDQTYGNSGKNPSLLGEQVAKAIAQAKSAGKPFFINSNITDPHRPFYGSDDQSRRSQKTGSKKAQAVEGTVDSPLKPEDVIVPSFLEDLPEIRKEISQYDNSVQRLDKSVGEILSALNASGQARDTIVVFLSDHGMSFPFSKATDYANGTWSPVIIRLPGEKSPQKREEIVSSLDILPTLLEALKVPVPAGLDGTSWLPLLRGEKQPGRDYVITHVNSVSSGLNFPMRCVRTKTRALIVELWPDGGRQRRVEAMKGLTFDALAAAGETDQRIGRRVSQYLNGVPVALYDLEMDPDERENVIDDPAYAEEGRRLTQLLLAEMEKTGDPQLENVRIVLAGGTAVIPDAKPNAKRKAGDD